MVIPEHLTESAVRATGLPQTKDITFNDLEDPNQWVKSYSDKNRLPFGVKRRVKPVDKTSVEIYSQLKPAFVQLVGKHTALVVIQFALAAQQQSSAYRELLHRLIEDGELSVVTVRDVLYDAGRFLADKPQQKNKIQ